MSFDVDAALAASLFAVDGHALGGVCIRSAASSLRDQWLLQLRDLLPPAAPWRKIPCNIADSRLLGGLDLVATLRGKRPVAERGVLACVDRGVMVIAMAERLTAHTANLLCSALEQGEIDVTREAVALRHATRFGIIALDEGLSDEESAPRCILDRCAFLLDFSAATARTLLIPAHDREQIDAARELLPHVTIDIGYMEALCATASALGSGSLRVSILAVLAARVLAALDGRSSVSQYDAQGAGRLVLAPRATVLPQQDDAASEDRTAGSKHSPPPANDAASDNSAKNDADTAAEEAAPEQARPTPAELQQMQDSVQEATQSAIPSGLLTQLRAHTGSTRAAVKAESGRYGALRKGGAGGRPTGTGPARADRSRFNIMETLRTAAPWQAIRGRNSSDATRLQIRAEDLRVTRYKQRSRTLTIFAVDASGSSALNRLAETKGAAELLLADCYVRRDQVAVVAFRGHCAEILLPPTRSLVRAKRSLSALPGGGGTPLATAIDMAALLASQARRRGESPIVVMLTDGRGNVARDGRVGREAGQTDAMCAARAFCAAGFSALFIDTSPRPHDLARDLARGMNASYVPLPFADARSLSRLIGNANSPGRARP